MKFIQASDIEALKIGAAILGSGGGGSTDYHAMMLEHMLQEKTTLPITALEEIEDEALVVPLAFMGAPLVAREKLPSGKEFQAIINEIEKIAGKRPDYLVAAEIGGANAFTPLLASCMLGIPVLNADTIGRAFPELQMSVCALKKLACAPAFLSDAFGTTAILNAKDPYQMERMARGLTVAFGARALVALYLMTGREAKNILVPGTLKQACQLGNCVLQAGLNGRKGAAELANKNLARPLANGMIVDIEQTIEKGFLIGKLVIETEKKERITVRFQNEYLLAEQDEKTLASSPDLIVLMEEESGIPISTASLEYYLKVDLLQLESPAIWKTPDGMKLTGPDYFKCLRGR